MDMVGKKYVHVIPSCWKAEKIPTVNHILEVKERKKWSGENVSIPAGSVKLVKKKSRGRLERQGICKTHATRRKGIRLKIVTENCQAVHELYR